MTAMHRWKGRELMTIASAVTGKQQVIFPRWPWSCLQGLQEALEAALPWPLQRPRCVQHASLPMGHGVKGQVSLPVFLQEEMDRTGKEREWSWPGGALTSFQQSISQIACSPVLQYFTWLGCRRSLPISLNPTAHMDSLAQRVRALGYFDHVFFSTAVEQVCSVTEWTPAH